MWSKARAQPWNNEQVIKWSVIQIVAPVCASFTADISTFVGKQMSLILLRGGEAAYLQ